MLINRNIIIKKEANKFLLPTFERKEVEVVGTFPNTYAMCRIISYEQNSGKLNLKLARDIVGEAQFQTSTEINSEILSPLFISQINLISSSSFASSDSPTMTDWIYKKDRSYKAQLKNDEDTAVSDRDSNRIEKAKEKNTINISIGLSVNEIKFLDGKVSFEYYINEISRKVDFEISNPFLKKEFDSIKNYFLKVLNIKRFAVTIQLDLLDKNILNTTCTSSHISNIDASIFELVEDLYITDHITNGDRDEIVSLDQIALDLSEKIGSENIKDSEWLLNKLIASGKTKHYFHLRYLSSKQLSNAFNLKITGKPLSFIFLIPTAQGYCLIWETYSTDEATYVWKLNNLPNSELSSAIQENVDLIKWLRKKNKTAFLKKKPDNFIKIEHNYFGEDLGFKKWKSELEGFILEKGV